MSDAIFDNHVRSAAIEFFKKHLKPGADLSFATAYFTIYAYDALRAELEGANKLRLLFGDPKITLDPARGEHRAFLLTGDGDLALSHHLRQKPLARACAEWIERGVDIRSVKDGKRLLHGKYYHIENREKGDEDEAMLGSSNFTASGLGAANSGNIELNLLIDSKQNLRDSLSWFNEIWADEKLTVDVKERVLEYLEKAHENTSPEMLYYKTLFSIFRDDLDKIESGREELETRPRLIGSEIWKALFTFQRQAAGMIINKLNRYGGCILADSVGLGKTYTALAVIKYFEEINPRTRVLVLAPKKIADNWRLFRQSSEHNPLHDDNLSFDVLHHTDLSRESGDSGGIDLSKHNWAAYDLIVIDESHNFRNSTARKATPDGDMRLTRYGRLIEEAIKPGAATKVLLLSATPVNNSVADLRNQISLIAGGDVMTDSRADEALARSIEIGSVKQTCQNAQTQFTQWAKRPAADRKAKGLLESLGGDFYRLLDRLSIARSRKMIERGYAADMERLGGFPKRERPVDLHPGLDAQGAFPPFSDLHKKIGGLKLTLYSPTFYLREDLDQTTRDQYQRLRVGVFTQEGRERYLIGMMRVNLLKRLESSVDSYRLTLGRMIAKIDALEGKIARYERHRTAAATIEAITEDDLEDNDDLEPEDLEIGGRYKTKLEHLDLTRWMDAVREDRAQLADLLREAEAISTDRDAKLALLRERIAAKITAAPADKDGKPNRKVLIFTAFADTARYLYENLADWAQAEHAVHSALVQGSDRCRSTLGKSDFADILANFAPRAHGRAAMKHMPQDEEIDILIATDCISEGQNLQDCDLVINYDIHWNPVRIIQRYGRIDRIGSRNHAVGLINFWPTADLDAYLNVKTRVESRMALADIAGTGEDNVLRENQEGAELHIRNQQLKRMIEGGEILDLDDLGDDGVSIQDFSLDEFRADLIAFLNDNKDKLDALPDGLSAIVSAQTDELFSKRGVVFCLRQKTADEQQDADAPTTDPLRETRRINPLAPHYLVHVSEDAGVVIRPFTNPKPTLETLRKLCMGVSADEDLCFAFDREIASEEGFARCNSLLKTALGSIVRDFAAAAAAPLTHDREALLPIAAAQPRADDRAFDLVSWFIIR